MKKRENQTAQFVYVLLSSLIKKGPLLTDLSVRIEINFGHVLQKGGKAVGIHQLELLLPHLQDESSGEAGVVAVLLFEEKQGFQDLLKQQPNELLGLERGLNTGSEFEEQIDQVPVFGIGFVEVQVGHVFVAGGDVLD